MKYVVIDFETASTCDLNKRGAWVYAADMSTFILCLGYKLVVDGRPQPTRVLDERQVRALDTQLMELVKDENIVFAAHNASFEQAIWKFQMEPMGWPKMPPERWHDTMAVAAMKGLPLGLDKLTQALDLNVRKDMDGHRLMMRMCKPNLKGEWEHSAENIQRLKQYNVGDCDSQYGSHVVLRGLGPSERQNWLLDQKVNQRGIKIDREFISACQDVLNQVRVPMKERFKELTGNINPTQRDKFLNWINDQGVPLLSLRKEVLDDLLNLDEFEGDDLKEPLPFHVYEALNLRRSLASSSVSKLQRMLDCAHWDGRVRYTMQYHGARTGRESGRLIQIQNYPRGTIQERQGMTPEYLADLILTRDVNRIEEVWGPDIFDAVISSLRSCIVPSEGRVLVGGDYAQIEARIVLAMSGQHDKAAMLASGVDVYCEMGSLIFKHPVNKKEHPRERHVGKGAVLGCLAANTQVLTDKGWKAIVDVTTEDKVWDGIEYVTHEGLVFRGSQKTQSLSNLHLTPNHLVYTGERWLPARRLEPKTLYQALDYAEENLPLSDMPTQRKDSYPPLLLSAIVATGLISSISIVLGKAVIKSVGAARTLLANLPVLKNTELMPKYAPTKTIEPGCLIEYRLFKAVAVTQRIESLVTTEGEEYAYTQNGSVKAAGLNRLSNPGSFFFDILCRWKDGITQTWKLIESTITEVISQEISGLLQKSKTPTIGDRWKKWKTYWEAYAGRLVSYKKKLNTSEPVYDLMNAGPRNRFMVRTDEGPLIVHNCGFGLGGRGFKLKFAPNESIDLCLQAVNTYRTEFAPLVPKFWYGLDEASTKAVWCTEAKAYEFGGVEFQREQNFLTMRLPSGRKIWYHKPEKYVGCWPSGDDKPGWSAMTYQGSKIRRKEMWYGELMNNLVQGTARDIMVHASHKAEANGLPVVFKVHDEIVCEPKRRPGLAQDLKQIMEDLPTWAHERRFLLSAEVEEMERYKK